MFWLSESVELQKTKEQALSTNYISKLDVHVELFDDSAKKKLQALEKTLEAKEVVEHIDSMFAKYYLYNEDEASESSLIKAMCFCKLNADETKAFVKKFPKPYENFVSKDFKTFTFIIYASSQVELSAEDIGFDFTYTKPNLDNNHIDYVYYTGFFVLFLFILFYVVFRTTISSLAAIVIIGFTLIFSFEVIYLLLGVENLHVAMSLIIVSISLVDYLYFYYRWHVSQYKDDPVRALQKMLNRNLAPAFWTTLITLIGVGSMFFVDSEIVRVLSLSLISSSVISYILNITLLPAILSYTKVKKPHVKFARVCYLFANIELHYNKKYLSRFIFVTFIILLLGSYRLIMTPEELFEDNSKNNLIELKVPYEELDVEFLEEVGKFDEALKKEFVHVSTDSLYSTLAQLSSKTINEEDKEQQMLEALFFVELYDIENSFTTEDALILKVRINSSDKLNVIKWITQYKDLDIYITDMDSLLSSAKIDKTLLLAISLSTALLIIGLIMGRIFRSKEMIVVGFIANATPIAWFGLFTFVFDITLSLELLIAMTITVGLASDATVHFAFKYFRSRYFGRSFKHSLEKMFFYASIPVMIGTLVLSTVFMLLTFSEVQSLILIGGFGSILMLLSLLTDIFLLPPLLMLIDKFAYKVK